MAARTISRFHPDRRRRDVAEARHELGLALYEIAMHALFGLGTLVCRRPGRATIIVP